MALYCRVGKLGRVAAEGAGLGTGWARRFEHSGEGDLLRRDDTLRGTTTYQHDEAHRLAKVRLSDGSEQSYVYDRAGNLVTAPGLIARMQRENACWKWMAMNLYTYDHDPPLVQRYNDHGHDQTRAQRADDSNDPSKLTPMSRSDNSAKSGGVNDDGSPRTYRQDQGPNFQQ